ncbi:unnamed protein product [Brugia timori]|uniref:MaoC-like domain-containing protein n=1 Tax=Brugia timori TaxID=42155 RepID=A0A0R3Q909_9BILA|nr:unnamed protein product [Brugia timori]
MTIGARFITDRHTLTEEAIVMFGTLWDPQPFHIDAEAAKQSMFGRIIASGLHTVLVTYRLFNQLKLWGPQALAGLGYRDIQFKAPVFAGDTLHAVVTILEKRESSRDDRGTVTFQISTWANDSRKVLSLTLDILGSRKPVR